MKFAVITSRPGLQVEAGEWNLIHGRNSSLSLDLGQDVRMFCLQREDRTRLVEPPHWSTSTYPIELRPFKHRVHGEFVAARNATLEAIEWGANVIIYSGRLSGAYSSYAKHRGVLAVWDIHGAVRAEVKEYSQGRGVLKELLRESIYEKTMRSADAALVVTPELQVYSAAMAPRARFFLVPCASNTNFEAEQVINNRLLWRSKFNISESSFVLLHSGGIGKWQMTDAYFRTFASFQAKVRDSLLLILTSNVGEAQAQRSQLPDDVKERCLIFRVSRDDLPGALCAADVGLLLREVNVTNQVAFPNKIDDYLASGLVLATTAGLPAASRLIENGDVAGQVLKTADLELLSTSAHVRSAEMVLETWRKAKEARERISFGKTLGPLVAWAAGREYS